MLSEISKCLEQTSGLTLENNLVDQNIGADQVRCVGFHQCSEDFPP